MPTPRPGHPVRGSTTGLPLMAALDLFGRRWSLRVLWELRAGPLGFRPLQKRCDDMSSSVMRQRLTELLDAQVIHQLPDSRYELTPLGQEARRALDPSPAGRNAGRPPSARTGRATPTTGPPAASRVRTTWATWAAGQGLPGDVLDGTGQVAAGEWIRQVASSEHRAPPVRRSTPRVCPRRSSSSSSTTSGPRKGRRYRPAGCGTDGYDR